jgi:RecB family endonuclease NucS
MSPPCRLDRIEIDEELASGGVVEAWKVTHQKTGDTLTVRIHEIIHDTTHDLGVDPGLIKDGVEADLQRLLAEQVDLVAEGSSLVRREYPTAIGPVDLMIRDAGGVPIAVEIKRRGEIDGVEQLTRYLDLLGRDPLLTGIRGVFAAQEIKPQARVLAEDRGIECLVLDYERMKGIDSGVPTLF